jgi:uncharacterized protein (TIGR00255 family)
VSVRSMTGFARVRRTIAAGEIVVSLKSVNHRGLDLHFHLPPELDPMENDVRGIIKQGMARGHVQVHVSFVRAVSGEGAAWNRALVDAYMRAFQEARALYDLDGHPDLNAALRLPGVFCADVEADLDEAVSQAVREATAEAMVVLNQFREREGVATAAEMSQRCQSIGTLVSRMDQIRAGAVPAFQKRLRDKLSDLLHGSGIDAQRLAQEAALLADRSDIAEELVRLRTHAAQLNQILAGDGEVGKRLDFLLQEMNRESNTILSKTGGLGDLGLTITELALAAKSEIDKIREQSLNLE